MSVTTNGDARVAAADHWRAAADRGENLTGAQLGERYGRSPGWGRAVIREARQTTAPPAAVVAVEPQETPEVEPEPVPEPVPSTEADVPLWVGRLTVASVLLVASAAAVASVDHLAEVARLAGTGGWRAWLLPAAVDGLAVAAALTLYRAHRTGRKAGWLPWGALLAGLGASVAGNVVAVYPELVAAGHLKIAVGATPPLSLALAVELALRQVRQT